MAQVAFTARAVKGCASHQHHSYDREAAILGGTGYS
jgi:hypothetical protein